MAIGLTVGHVYFLESDAVDNQNWIAGGASTIDLTNFTEGTEFCQLEMPQRWLKKFSTGIVVTDAGGGTSFDFRSARRGYSMLAEGIETSTANADLVEKFFMIDRHTSGGSATFKEYYMVIINDTAAFLTFIDASNAVKTYCPVRASGGEIVWVGEKPQTAIFRVNVRSVW